MHSWLLGRSAQRFLNSLSTSHHISAKSVEEREVEEEGEEVAMCCCNCKMHPRLAMSFSLALHLTIAHHIRHYYCCEHPLHISLV